MKVAEEEEEEQMLLQQILWWSRHPRMVCRLSLRGFLLALNVFVYLISIIFLASITFIVQCLLVVDSFQIIGTVIPNSQEPSFCLSISTDAKFSSDLEFCFLYIVRRCQYSDCSLTCVVRAEECRCCMEVNLCTERMEEVDKDGQCITMHPGFDSVCLNRWVLQTAGTGLKTKLKKSYTTMLTLGDRAVAE